MSAFKATTVPPGPEEAQGPVPSRMTLACVFAALTLEPLAMSLMNSTLFPLLGQTFAYSRDIGILSAVLACALVATTAKRRPEVLHRQGLYTASALVLWLAGLAGALVAARRGDTAALVICESLSQAGGSWLELLILLAASAVLRGRALYVAVPCSLALGVGLGSALAYAPVEVGLAVYAGSLAAGAVLVLSIARRSVSFIADAPAGADLSLTWPSSFLSPFDRLFLCILAFSVATGFALRFGVQEGRADTAPFAVAALLCAVPCCLLSHSRERFDTLFKLALLFTLGGFLLAPVDSAATASKGLLSVGDSLYQLVSQLVLLSLAQRNRVAGLTVLAWGSCWQNLGITLGANLGALAHMGLAADTVSYASALVGFGLLAFFLFGLGGFSFDATIAGVLPVQPVEVREEDGSDKHQRSCAALAQKCALTTRELDILLLLARGRNNSYIQEELTLTRNTVKSHIRHIYTKLDVHSQQELIDLVEGRAKEER